MTESSAEALAPPRYRHDCSNCSYLGRSGSDDLYACPTSGSLIAREGDDGPEYLSTPIPEMYRAHQLQEAFERACAQGVLVSTPRDRVLCALFAPLGTDTHARHALAYTADSMLTHAFHPDHWEVAEGLLSQGGRDFLLELAKGADLLAAPAVRRASRKGVSSLLELKTAVADADAYLRETEPAEYSHDPGCSASGNPHWAHVDECGSCNFILQERERLEREALWQELEKLEPDPEQKREQKLMRRLLGGPNVAMDVDPRD